MTLLIYSLAGFIDYGKRSFLGAHLSFSDLYLAPKEFGDVAIDFAKEYILWPQIITLLLIICISIFLYVKAKRVDIKWKFQVLGVILCLFCGFVSLKALDCFFYEKKNFNYFIAHTGRYYQIGFCFALVNSYSYEEEVSPPSNYNEESVREIVENCTSPLPQMKYPMSEIKPFVIVWQSESFEDLRRIEQYAVSSEVYAPFDEIVKQSTHCKMLSSVYYTVNCQFEALTGLFYSEKIYPNTASYIALRPAYGALGYCFAKLGYAVSSLGRSTTLQSQVNGKNFFGIDRHIPVDPRETPKHPNTGQMLDGYLADATLKFVEEHKRDATPHLLIVQTLQNHAPHKLKQAREGISVTLDGTEASDLTAFAVGINDTGLALRNLLNRLKEVDIPVVFVFYGDHPVPSYLRCLKPSPSLEQNRDARSTEFFIWSNYLPPLGELAPVTMPFLSNILMRYIGLPMTRYQWFLERFANYSRGVSFRGSKLDSKGVPVEDLGEEAKKYVEMQWMLEYDTLYGRNYSGDKLFEFVQ